MRVKRRLALAPLSRLFQLAVEARKAQRQFKDWIALILTYTGVRSFAPGMVFHLKSSSATVQVWEAVDVISLWGVFCRGDYPVLADDQLIVDVGASVGTFSVFAASRAPAARVIAYEPVLQSYERLLVQVSQKGLDGRVKCQRAAIGGSHARRTLKVATDSVRSSFFTHMIGSPLAEQEVLTVPLESVVAEAKNQRISLLKMDCEGAEWEALDSVSDSALQQIERVSLEYHLMPGRDPDELVKRLMLAGFVKEALIRHPNLTGILQVARPRK